MKRAIVTGSRCHPQLADVWVEIDRIIDFRMFDEWLVGDCPTGVDAVAKQLFECRDVPFRVFRADWEKYGRAAGPLRNEAMVETPGVEACFGFPFGGSKGTRGCMNLAEKAGINTFEWSCAVRTWIYF